MRSYQATEGYRKYIQACMREAFTLPWINVKYGKGKSVSFTLIQWMNQGGE